MSPVDVEIEGRRLSLSNLDKVLYPASGTTKGEVLNYYTRIAPVLLGHYRGRQVTLKRYPNGVDAPFFYEKNCPGHRPDWVQTAPTWSGHSGRTINFCVVNDLSTLIWLANLASLELHLALGRADQPGIADSVVFDLDPGAPAGIVECCRVALRLRDVLASLGLGSVVKTSGSKGMQLYVPLNSGTPYEHTRGFALALARLLEKGHPSEVLSNMRKDLRTGRVFIDWSQNNEHKTTIGVYSLRARERPTVSAPVAWEEVEAAADGGAPPAFEAAAVLERAAAHGDLFEPMLSLRQELPAL